MELTLREILTTIDTMVPNSLSYELKIQWINHIQNQLYRDYPVPESVYAFGTVPDQQIYAIPNDCAEDGIKQVVVDEETYDFVPQGTDADAEQSSFYSIVLGALLIYPSPTESKNAYVHYRARPVHLTVVDLDTVPNFPGDFIELLILGCASRVAKTAPETLNLASVFDRDYQQLADKADRVLRKTKPKRINVVRSWY